MLPYVLLHKEVGQTPLQIIEQYKNQHPELKNIPMAYAGRLDPMASGQLLVLIGEECKHQEKYHALDKTYVFEVLFGVGSDSQDVLGLLQFGNNKKVNLAKDTLNEKAQSLTGKISLPYPIFSSKTVKGKPLHTWALENRLAEIAIPVAKTKVYQLVCQDIREVLAEEVYTLALEKINSIPEVTDERKALGQDFRREAVRLSWKVWLEHHKNQTCTIATFACTASSGTYMRSLASALGEKFNTPALAFSINRTAIGVYQSLPFGFGFWRKKF
jgi:tRNA U55 pseudouridine synthase TruB